MNSFWYWRRLLKQFGPVSPGLRHRAILINLFSPLTAGLRLQDRLIYGRRIAKTAITRDPLFILGHWRTGTTHLHNVLAHDPQFGFVTTLHTQAPGLCITGRPIMKPILKFFMPAQRPMDNMALDPDLPQEEDFAVCNECPHAYYIGLYFPNHVRALFHKWVLFENVSDEEKEEWSRAYKHVIQKATFIAKGKQLVLKNPPNTARALELLELFPNAKFVHIYRNPYAVFKSTMRLAHAFRRWMALQDIGEEQLEINVLHYFREMMTRYLAIRDKIPAGQLTELRYEDLEQRPVEELARVYRELSVPGWETAREPIEAYLASQADYQKNTFTMLEADIAKVEAHWQFAIDAWGYERPAVARG
ncbi:MAG TPA: sulfotransferase [Candidatus Hydrogenedentes bacterium]|nr:sulfotransferase [Candidatus Hydrogenedentota bacterium]